MSKRDWLVDLINALHDFRLAWQRLDEVFGNIYFNCNDVVTEKYPFEKSFDDYSLDIDEWIDSCVEKASEMYKEENR